LQVGNKGKNRPREPASGTLPSDHGRRCPGTDSRALPDFQIKAGKPWLPGVLLATV
jgi:hypothetical protein